VLVHERLDKPDKIATWLRTINAPTVTPVEQTADLALVDPAAVPWAATVIVPALTAEWLYTPPALGVFWFFPNPTITRYAPSPFRPRKVSRAWTVVVPSVTPVVVPTVQTRPVAPEPVARAATGLTPSLVRVRVHPPMDDDTTYRVRREVYV
jgi:hypothetical protein